jgi:hypothetical protein
VHLPPLLYPHLQLGALFGPSEPSCSLPTGSRCSGVEAGAVSAYVPDSSKALGVAAAVVDLMNAVPEIDAEDPSGKPTSAAFERARRSAREELSALVRKTKSPWKCQVVQAPSTASQ